MRLRLAIGVCCVVTALASAGAAQEPASFPSERLHPALDRDGIIDVEWGAVGEHLTYDVTLGLGYAHNPLLLYRRTATGGLTGAGALVEHRLGADLVGSLSLFDWVEVGLGVPVTLYQGRGPPTPGAALSGLQAAGFGDLRLVPKVRILNAAQHYVDLAVLVGITFPSGVPTGSYMGDKTVTFVPEVVLSRKLPGLRLALNLGYRVRDTTRQLGLRVGSEVTYRLGAAHRLDSYLSVPLEIDASLSGSIAGLNATKHFNRNPMELLLAGAYDLGSNWQVYLGTGFGIIAGYATPDVRVFLGVRFSPRSGDRDGDSIKDAIDACPGEAEDFDEWQDDDGCPDPDNDGDGIPDVSDGAPFEPEDKDGYADNDGVPDPDNDGDGIPDAKDHCPNAAEDFDGDHDDDGCPDLDRDGDGVPDAVDACPDVAEDKDHFEDSDGCPEEDNDEDGIFDAEDHCPNLAETLNGFQDDDGCPDVEPAVKVTLKRTELEIHGQVYFDSGKSTIKERSFDLLRQVAKLLNDNTQILKLEIEGHTDSQGNAEDNMVLSQDRSDSVRRFLIKEGVDSKRLTAHGYGQTRPIADNKSERGRSLNRRVAFTILESTEVAAPAPASNGAPKDKNGKKPEEHKP